MSSILQIQQVNFAKLGDIAEDAMTQILVNSAQQMPPSNLQQIMELLGQVAEKHLTEELQRQADPSDMGPHPMDLENRRLSKEEQQLDSVKKIRGHHRDLAAMDLEDKSIQHSLGNLGGAGEAEGAGVSPGGGGVPTGVAGLPGGGGEAPVTETAAPGAAAA